MKALAVKLIGITVLLIVIPVYSQAEPGEGDKGKKEKKKFIQFPRLNDDTAWLDLKKGGYTVFFSPPKIIGTRKIENDGFRFIPAVEPPDGVSEQAFHKFYRFSPLIKEIFIPYTEIKSVKPFYGITIRTKDGMKYHFRCQKPRQDIRELRSKLV